MDLLLLSKFVLRLVGYAKAREHNQTPGKEEQKTGMDFRYEWKHEIAYGDLLALQPRLAAVMRRDSHAIDGRYEIRSLYFDNLQDKALREKIDGVNNREKFRIRYYNGDTSLLLLEKKRKINGLCAKEQARLEEGRARALALGDPRPWRARRIPWCRSCGERCSP